MQCLRRHVHPLDAVLVCIGMTHIFAKATATHTAEHCACMHDHASACSSLRDKWCCLSPGCCDCCKGAHPCDFYDLLLLSYKAWTRKNEQTGTLCGAMMFCESSLHCKTAYVGNHAVRSHRIRPMLGCKLFLLLQSCLHCSSRSDGSAMTIPSRQVLAGVS